MLEKFKNHIEQHFPELLNAFVAIASSGGIDSMVLFYLCFQLDLKLSILHCNFQLRGEDSDGDAFFLAEKMKTLQIPFYSVKFDTETYAKTNNLSTQLAARALRYDWFEEQRELLKFDYLLTAHHLDDNLETFLINLSRGTGIDGLTGIPERNKYILRPLLPFSRDEILQFAQTNKIEWREDKTNAETKYLRNKLRHDIIPKLKEINPSFLGNFQNTLQHLKGTAVASKKYIDTLRLNTFNYESDKVCVSVPELNKIQQKEMYLYELFKEYGFENTADLLQILNTQSGKQLLSTTHRLVKNRDELIITPIIEKQENNEVLIPENLHEITSPICLKFSDVAEIETQLSNAIFVDKKQLQFPLKLRKWEEGDTFYPFGMRGKKKLSKFFKDEKYSLIEKESQWLLCNGNDEIIWVVGKRADNRFRVVETTSEIIKIEYLED
ncbi:tRNA lysidine(34) synthetase TilS [Joostella sp. CR20]|uniref:tRNA lysidine(34) synthetase TilS n=1 Tax=Joostella sp. CR20 TaxID=2804312 RepID=UPI00313BE210